MSTTTHHRTFEKDRARLVAWLNKPYHLERAVYSLFIPVFTVSVGNGTAPFSIMLLFALMIAGHTALSYLDKTPRPYGVSPSLLLGATFKEHSIALLSIIGTAALLASIAPWVAHS